MTTPDLNEVNARLEQLLADLREIPAPPPPEPSLAWKAPSTEGEVIDMLTAILEPHDATPEEIEQARADALEIRRRTHEHAQVVAEKQKTDPHWPRFAGASPPGTPEPEPGPAKKPRSGSSRR